MVNNSSLTFAAAVCAAQAQAGVVRCVHGHMPVMLVGELDIDVDLIMSYYDGAIDETQDGSITFEEYFSKEECSHLGRDKIIDEFKKRDLNKDYKINSWEVRMYHAKELEAQVKPIDWESLTQSWEIAEVLIKRADFSGEGRVNMQEFKGAAPLIFSDWSNTSNDRIESYFTMLDIEGEGFYDWGHVDGYVREQEQFRDDFDETDTNGNGLVDYDEYRTRPFEMLNTRLFLEGEELLDHFWSKMDLNGDGQLSFDEEAWRVFRTEFNQLSIFRKTFEQIAHKGENTFTFQQMKDWSFTSGHWIPEQQLKEWFAAVDLDGDEKAHIIEVYHVMNGNLDPNQVPHRMTNFISNELEQVIDKLNKHYDAYISEDELRFAFSGVWSDELVDTFISHADKNFDGVIHVDELLASMLQDRIKLFEFKELEWNLIDQDRNDVITLEDVKQAKRRVQILPFQKVDAFPDDEAYFASLDTNGDGQVTYQEACLTRLPIWECPGAVTGEWLSEYERTFHFMDTNSDGVVTLDEMTDPDTVEFLYGEDVISEADLTMAFRVADLNGDGRITLEEGLESEHYSEDRQAVFEKLDELYQLYSGGDSELSFDEFAKLTDDFADAAKIEGQGDLADELFDAAGGQDGLIERPELADLISQVIRDGLRAQFAQ